MRELSNSIDEVAGKELAFLCEKLFKKCKSAEKSKEIIGSMIGLIPPEGCISWPPNGEEEYWVSRRTRRLKTLYSTIIRKNKHYESIIIYYMPTDNAYMVNTCDNSIEDVSITPDKS